MCFHTSKYNYASKALHFNYIKFWENVQIFNFNYILAISNCEHHFYPCNLKSTSHNTKQNH